MKSESFIYNKIRHKKLKTGAMIAVALLLIMICGCEAKASMNLETDAAVSGISVALNNYYARTMNPESALAESVKMVADDAIVVDEGTNTKTKKAVNKLVREVTPTEEKIVREGEGGLTWGTVKGTKSLRLRSAADSAAKTLTLLSEGEHYIVTGQEGQFLKIQVDDDLEGYVFKDYIDTSISYDDEIAREKESLAAQAKEAKKEAEEALKALEDAKKAQEASTAKADNTETKSAETKNSETKSSETKAAETKATEAATEKKTDDEDKTQADDKTTETVEALQWDDETEDGDNDDSDDADEAEDRDTVVQTVEAPDFDEEMEAIETEEEEEEEIPAETIKSTDGTGPGGVTDATRTAMVAYAKQFLGNPYVYGGTSLTDGCDCSGFTQAIYKYFGKSIGRSSRDQASNGTSINPSEAQPGDLFFYDSNGTINHVAMYIGGGQVIHSSSTATGIKISNAYYRTPCKVCTFF